jgi:hypothetical protein
MAMGCANGGALLVTLAALATGCGTPRPRIRCPNGTWPGCGRTSTSVTRE